jgi:hypothetical protein
MAQAALDALFDLSESRLAVMIQFKSAIIDGGAKSDTAAASMAESRFLDFLNQIEKSFHIFSF